MQFRSFCAFQCFACITTVNFSTFSLSPEETPALQQQAHLPAPATSLATISYFCVWIYLFWIFSVNATSNMWASLPGVFHWP